MVTISWKAARRTTGIALVLFIIFNMVDCHMMTVAEESSGFTKNQWWAYYFYTDDEIKHAPRLSDDHYYLFRARNGASADMSTVIYRNVTDAQPLRNYLSSLGYHSVNNNPNNERWEKENSPVPCFYIQTNRDRRTVEMTKLTL